MSLPPEQVRIKRKKGDEPVDSLYIETEHLQKRRRFTDFIFRRVQTEKDTANLLEPAGTPKRSQSYQRGDIDPYAAKVPTIQIRGSKGLATKIQSNPKEDGRSSTRLHGVQDGENVQCTEVAEPSSTTGSHETRPKSSQFTTVDMTKSQHPTLATADIRKFHLTKPSFASFPQGPAGGKQKRKLGQRTEVAVFIERERRLKKPKSLINLGTGGTAAKSNNSKEVSIAETCSGSASPALPRKRPNASAAEKKWRVEHWNKGSSDAAANSKVTKTGITVHSNSSLWNYESPELAAQLQEIALQQLRQPSLPPTPSSPQGDAKLRIKPKVPAERYADRHTEDITATVNADLSDWSNQIGGEEDYVVDVFTRYPIQPLMAHSGGVRLNQASAGQSDGIVGLLVITEEDQALWEAYAEDEDNERDWNSEEEDENGWLTEPKHIRSLANLTSAEDFYGNDYPEDEVESDDEYGHGAYNHRQGASDDEEFDEDTGAWSSDDAEDSRYPWKRNP
ncbi:MAG: hypothetical protein M1827_006791 [Pycnora praestabilis]|nr:MAG: hypothetical protein M1827_006791 [Pycnora praestabilis]